MLCSALHSASSQGGILLTVANGTKHWEVTSVQTVAEGMLKVATAGSRWDLSDINTDSSSEGVIV